MKIRGMVVVEGQMTITSEEAEILEHLTSYDLADWFKLNCNRTEMPIEKIKEGLRHIRSQCAIMLEAKKAANEKLNEYINPKQKTA